MAEVQILVGAPGSGKSTYAQELGLAIICPDSIRGELTGNEVDQRATRQAWDIAFTRMTLLGQKGIPFVLDATNVKRRDRSAVARHINLTFPGATLVAVVFTTPLEECLRRNAQRARVVPEEVIRRMHQRLEGAPVRLEEGFARVEFV